MSPIESSRVRVRACAKINLTLRVLGVHADGYHELRTTFQSLALHDTLTFRAVRGPFVITSNDDSCPADRTNLVWKAADRMWAASGRPGTARNVHVHIVKRVPLQAGLGGGSSDAAAALRALRVLWNLKVPDARLAVIGRDLGADVGFFLEGGTVLGVERGDLLFPLQDAARAWVVIAQPAFGVSTRDAYAWWDEAQRSRRRTVVRSTDRQTEWVNDLQPPVVRRHPEIAALVGRLQRAGARYAAMSGSGSAVFGLFDSSDAARRVAGALSRGDVRTWLTRTADRREYLRVSAPRLIPPRPKP